MERGAHFEVRWIHHPFHLWSEFGQLGESFEDSQTFWPG